MYVCSKLKLSLFALSIYLLTRLYLVNILNYSQCIKEETFSEDSYNYNVALNGKFRTISYDKETVVEFLDTTDRNVREYRLNEKESGGGTDAARVIFMLEIYKWLQGRHFEKTLLFNEGDMSNPHIEAVSHITEVHQYKNGKGDIHNLHYLGKNIYNLVYVPQTLEHARYPLLAALNLYSITARDGYVIASQPWITRPHMGKIQYQSFTPYALEVIFKTVGFKVKDIFCWGNDEYVTDVLVHRKWPKVTNLKDLNTPKNHYAQCTIIAKK